MIQFSERTIAKIETNLKLHINYKGVPSGGAYLEAMDKMSYNYSGARGLALSNMLDDYFKQVGVKNLDEAFSRLRRYE